MQSGESFNNYIDRLMAEEAARKAGRSMARDVVEEVIPNLSKGADVLIECGGIMTIPRVIFERSSTLVNSLVQHEDDISFVSIPEKFREIVWSSYIDYTNVGTEESAVASMRNLVDRYPDDTTAGKLALAIRFANYLQDRFYTSAIKKYIFELERDLSLAKRQVARNAWSFSGLFNL